MNIGTKTKFWIRPTIILNEESKEVNFKLHNLMSQKDTIWKCINECLIEDNKVKAKRNSEIETCVKKSKKNMSEWRNFF